MTPILMRSLLCTMMCILLRIPAEDLARQKPPRAAASCVVAKWVITRPGLCACRNGPSSHGRNRRAVRHLEFMMRLARDGTRDGGGYNELIVDAFHFRDHAPWSIEAIWCDPEVSRVHCAKQRQQHATLVEHFGLGPYDIPLLALKYSADGQQMFTWLPPLSDD